MKKMFHIPIAKKIIPALFIIFALGVQYAKAQSAGPNQTVCQQFQGGFVNVQMAATGTGTWSALPNNPGTVIIGNPNDPNTIILQFYYAGIYGFVWNTGLADTVYVTVNPYVRGTLTLTGGCLGHDSLVVTGASTADSIIWLSHNVAVAETIAADSFYIPTAVGYYEFETVSNQGCLYSNQDGDSVLITNNCSNAGPPQIVCQLSGHIVTAATGTGTWVALPTNPSVAWISDPTSPITGMADFDSVGVYAFKWGTAPGDTLYVTAFKAQVIQPVLSFLGPCHDTLVVHSPVGAVSATWVLNYSNIVFDANDTILVATAAGVYSAYIESDSGCESLLSDTLNVTLTVPAVSFTPYSFVFCQGKTDTFTAGPVNGGTSPGYQWYQDGVAMGTNSPVYITSTAVNEISVIMTSNLACITPKTAFFEDTFSVYPTPLKPAISSPGSCLGSGPLSISTATGDTIEWLLNGNPVHNSQPGVTGYLPAVQGIYSAYVTGPDGCKSAISDSVFLEACTSKDTVIICRGSSYTMQVNLPADSFVSYQWFPTYSLSSTTVLNPVAYPALSTTYLFAAVDTGGRVYRDTVSVIVDTACHGFVWPGDADENGVVNNYDLLPIGLTYGFTGPVREQQDINWYAHYATPWADTITGGINDVYSDCNGDGTVNINDVNAILQNYNLTHVRGAETGINRSGAPVLKISVAVDTLLNGDTLYCHILLGDSNTPANNIYGLAFTFHFDPLVVDTNTVNISFSSSWLATPTQQITLAKTDFNDGAIYAAASRINHTNNSGYGEIATVSMVITTDNIDGKDLSYYIAQLGLSGLEVINQAGDTLPVYVQGDSAIIGFYATGIEQYQLTAADIKLFPNPANNTANVLVTGGKITSLDITDVLGRQILNFEHVNASHFALSTANLTTGVYFAQIHVGDQILVKKFLVQH